MSALLRSRSRLFSIIPRNNRRLSSTATTEPPKETILSSSILGDQLPPPNGPPPPPLASEAEKNSWSFLKYGLITALTGGVATAGYATYGTYLVKLMSLVLSFIWNKYNKLCCLSG